MPMLDLLYIFGFLKGADGDGAVTFLCVTSKGGDVEEIYVDNAQLNDDVIFEGWSHCHVSFWWVCHTASV